MGVGSGGGGEENKLSSKKSNGRTCFHPSNILSVSIAGLIKQKMML
jgi:hypothetical protein